MTPSVWAQADGYVSWRPINNQEGRREFILPQESAVRIVQLMPDHVFRPADLGSIKSGGEPFLNPKSRLSPVMGAADVLCEIRTTRGIWFRCIRDSDKDGKYDEAALVEAITWSGSIYRTQKFLHDVKFKKWKALKRPAIVEEIALTSIDPVQIWFRHYKHFDDASMINFCVTSKYDSDEVIENFSITNCGETIQIKDNDIDNITDIFGKKIRIKALEKLNIVLLIE